MASNNGKPGGTEGKVDLFSFLKFLWKWKLIVITGTAIFILVSAITSYKSAKLFSVDMVIKPGILNISDSGKISYVDDHQTIVSLINLGLFKKDINRKIKLLNAEAKYAQTKIRATPKKKTNIIDVRYEAQSAKEGEEILNILLEELSIYYSDVTNSRRKTFQNQIDSLQSAIKVSMTHEKNTSINLEHLQKRINELFVEIEITEKKIQEINSLIKSKSKTENNSQIINLESLLVDFLQREKRKIHWKWFQK